MDEFSDPKNYFSEEMVEFLKEAFQKQSSTENIFFQGFRKDKPVIQNIKPLTHFSSLLEDNSKEQKYPCAVIHFHSEENLFKLTEEEIQNAEFLRQHEIAYLVVDFLVEKLYPVVDLFTGSEKLIEKEVLDLFQNEGPLAQKIPGYEARQPQLKMVQDICKAFNKANHLIVEAGTGTGKSYAYLIPSILLALKNQERILISTNTINLQEQLLQKDIPKLQEVLGKSFKAVLIKGRGNYICKRKLEDSVEGLKLFPTQDTIHQEVIRIHNWAQTSDEGSIAELEFIPSSESWEMVKSETDMCLRQQCKFHSTCFYYQSRRKAAQAQLLIANHHLLFADLSLRGIAKQGILPKYTRVVLDEAHNIEEVATTYFGQQSSKTGLLQLLNRIHPIKAKKNRGILHRTRKEIRKYSDELALRLEEILEEIANQHLEIHQNLSEEFDQLYYSLQPINLTEGFIRITEEISKNPSFASIQRSGRAIVQDIDHYIYALQEFFQQIKLVFTEHTPEELGILTELEGFLQRLNEQARVISLCLLQNSEHEVRWIEFRKKGSLLTLIFHLSPLHVAPLLKEKLFDVYNSVILTSATLSSNQNFKYLKSRIGLDLVAAEKIRESLLPSPFNFKEQCLLGIPSDHLLPNEIGYDNEICNFSEKVIRLRGGRLFILFTSFKSMNWVYEELRKRCAKQEITFLKQGLYPRSQLLEKFKANSKAVLLGVSSFWEGVDVAGEALSIVILTKIPFQVPSEPIIQARMEDLKAKGINPFTYFTLPQAIIKLKQGFGRLIRTSTDRGIVYILDRRLLTKYYGKQFIDSLPPAQQLFQPQATLIEELPLFFEEFYGSPQSI